MTHGVSGINWKQYKHPLPEHVYDVYMQFGGNDQYHSTTSDTIDIQPHQ